MGTIAHFKCLYLLVTANSNRNFKNPNPNSQKFKSYEKIITTFNFPPDTGPGNSDLVVLPAR